MFNKHDQQRLAEAYRTIAMPAVDSPVQKPVILSMDLGAPVEDDTHSHSDHKHHNDSYDHSEIEMAAADLYKIAEYAPKLQAMVENMPELEGWVSAKITKAADYISSVYHWLKYETDECDCDNEETEGIFTSIGAEGGCEAAAQGCKCGGCSECI